MQQLNNNYELVCIILLVALILIKLSIIYNKRKITDNKKAVDFSKQVTEDDIVKNNISKEIVLELYQLIEKHFKVKMCYLSSNDKIQYFYDMNSFECSEGCEDFEAELESKYNVKREDIDLKEKLLNLMIKMQNNTTRMAKIAKK